MTQEQKNALTETGRMDGRDTFSEYHPLVNFAFFTIVFGFSMLSMHPVCLLISFGAAACYLIRLRGEKAADFLLKGVLPLWLVTVIVNPAFSHTGETILCYLPRGNPLTLESILYGLDAGLMLAAVLTWFACFSDVVTSDKFMYLFGRITPALALLLSMTLRFIPRFKKQFDTVREVQKTLGHDVSAGPPLQRLKSALMCFSVVVTWSLENAVETADSMKSRGFGTKRRTAYTVYRFTDRDRTALVFLAFCAIFFISGGLAGGLDWRFYPSVRGALLEPLTAALEIAYGLFCFMPIIIDRREDALWKRFRSNI